MVHSTSNKSQNRLKAASHSSTVRFLSPVLPGSSNKGQPLRFFANGPLSQHPLPQQVLFTLVKYYVEPQLSMNKMTLIIHKSRCNYRNQ